MKRRFLSGNGSPAVTPQKPINSNTSTPRRKSKSRSRSRPRRSVGNEEPNANAGLSTPTPKKDKEGRTTTSDSAGRALRASGSTTSLRVRSHRTGETETSVALETDLGFDSERDAYRILPDRTGESTQPLRIRRSNTGGTVSAVSRDMTGSTTFLSEDRTGNTVYMTANDTGGTYRDDHIASQRTGDVQIGGVKTQRTGVLVPQQETADCGYVKRQRTGDDVKRQHTGDIHIRRQRTGDTELECHDTGTTSYSEVRRQRTGEKHTRRYREAEEQTRSGMHTEAETTRADFKLPGDRTGDAEVESLLGPIASMTTGDLIDLSPPSESSGSLSRIPLRVGTRVARPSASDYRSSFELGYSTGSTSASSVASSGYESSVSSIPDLASDFSDTTSTRSNGPSTPPSVSPPSQTPVKSSNGISRYTLDKHHATQTPTPRTRSKTVGHGLGISSADLANDEKCEKCQMPLFNIRHGGKFVTVPEEPTSTGAPPKRYHAACFTCKVCGEVFEEKEGGHAVFVREEEGACHVHVSL